jgi:hypothetical protein
MAKRLSQYLAQDSAQIQMCSENDSWSGDQDPCNPHCQRPCRTHGVSLLSSDDDSVSDNGHKEVALMIPQIGSLNFQPLNPQNQYRNYDNDANLSANPAHSVIPTADPAIRKALKKATMGRTKPEAILLEAAAAAAAATCGTPKEIEILEVEDMPVDLDDEGLVCTTCYEIILRSQYTFHRENKGCHLPARPPEAKQDKLSGISGCHLQAQPPEAKQDKLSCNTCHRRFKSELANDLHEPCEEDSSVHEEKSRRRQKWLTLAMAVEIGRRDV